MQMPNKLKREYTSPKNAELDEGEDLVLDFVEVCNLIFCTFGACGLSVVL
jgi:hypothetical protein